MQNFVHFRDFTQVSEGQARSPHSCYYTLTGTDVMSVEFSGVLQLFQEWDHLQVSRYCGRSIMKI